MEILGINTATGTLNLALVSEEKILWEYSSARSEETERLGLILKDLLQKNGQDFSFIKAIAVTGGPGSFTGLRLGIVAANTLAQSLALPLVSLPTLEALAWQNRYLKGLLITAVKARANDHHLAVWGARGGTVSRLSPDFIMSAEKLIKKLAEIKEAHYLAGADPALAAAGQDQKNKKNRTIWLAPADSVLRGSTVAQLGRAWLAQGKEADPFKLVPDYRLPPQIKKMSARKKFRF